MLSDAFGSGFAMPFSAISLLLVLLAAGLWADQLAGREVWRVPAAALAGLAAGVVLAWLDLALPYRQWVLPGAIILLGALVAFEVTLPSVLPTVVAGLAAVYHGYVTAALLGQAALVWLGFAAGATLALAGGIGLAAMIGHGISRQAVRLAGGSIAVLGGLIMFKVI
jgi:urease accessory protein